MKHLAQLFGRLASASLAVSALALFASNANAQQGPGVSDTEIKIGAYLPLSGPIASYGIPLLAGMQAAIHSVNETGGIAGRKFTLVAEDNKFNPQATVAIARKLITRDEVFAFVAPMGTPSTAAAMDYILKEAKVPIINPYAGMAEWYNPPRDYFYGAQVPLESQAKVIGRWAAKDGHKKLLAVHLTLVTNERQANEFAQAAKRMNPDVVVEFLSTKLGSTDFGPMAIEIASKKPDAIAMFFTQNETVALAKELRLQNVRIPIYTYAGIVINRVLHYVGLGSTEGATLAVGGKRLGGELAGGYFVEPTVFSAVNNNMSIAREEIFGPVISVIPFDDAEQALRLANDTEYGLGGAVWTQNVATAHKMANGIKAGTVWVNCYGAIDPSVGFGGYKMSGYGAKGGPQSIEGFLYQKVVYLNLG